MSNMDESAAAAFNVVGIGASAGGIKALKEFFQRMPSDSGMAFVAIVHLSREHESNLAGILQTCTSMPVTQVTETVKIEPNHVYVIPPSNHLVMIDGVIKLSKPEPIRGKRLPIDLFLRTLAEGHGKNGIAVILSGTGSDGALGLKRIKENGGTVFVQDPLAAEYDGMPLSAIATKLVDVISPVAELPGKMVAIYRFGERLNIPAVGSDDQKVASESAEDKLLEILSLLKIRTGHDFSSYKRPTLLRRIGRRLQVHQVDGLPAYVDLLRQKPEELQALMRDLLITVTNFFRDKEAFDFLEHHVVPGLFVDKTVNDTIRVWVCACATGEEAYSIAILLKEFAAKISGPPKIQIFASDINEEAIRTARQGRYSETILADVSGERLERYFIKGSDSYSVKNELREIILFTPHNILRDQPFSRIDVVSCRNLLIYLQQEKQKEIFELFNFALRTGGYLLLGSAESVEHLPALFSVIDRRHRIYKCLQVPARHRFPAMPTRSKREAGNVEDQIGPHKPMSFGAFHYEVLERFAPPSILINGEYEIVHASERAGRFMHFAGGEPTRDLIKMVHPALQLELRAALMEAKQDNRETEARQVRVRLDNAEREVNLIVRPVEMPRMPQGYFLVTFDEAEQIPSGEPLSAGAGNLENDRAMESVVQRLEDELVEMRHRLQMTVEQSDTSNEELKASNEEFQAVNEELRSASEGALPLVGIGEHKRDAYDMR
jgi:two-component system CheB/CheR fusion protein